MSALDGHEAAGSVLVTDVGRGAGLVFVRSLGRAGYRVVAVDSDPHSPGFASRWAAVRRVVPAPERDSPAFVEAIVQAVRDEGVRLVVPVTDAAIVPLAAQRERIESMTRLAVPPAAALAAAADKARTLEAARRLGIRVPDTALVHTADEARAAAGPLGWPVVLKPRFSRTLEGDAVAAHEVRYAADAGELDERMQSFEGRCAVLLQRYCPGIGQGVEVLAHEGRPLLLFQHRRRREVPVTGGASADRESVALDPRLVAPALRLIEALAWSGLAMVEFKVGAGEPVLMEVNGRPWGSLPLAVAAGVDFPRGLAALMLQGAAAVTPSLDGAYRLGLRSRDLQRDLAWMAHVVLGRKRTAGVAAPPRRAALGAALELLDPRHRDDFLEWGDVAPALHRLPRIALKLWSKRRAAGAGPASNGVPVQ